MDIDQIARFAFEPNHIVWWVAVFGLAFFAFLAFVFWNNCFGFNCFMSKRFRQEEEDDEYI